MNWSDIKQGMVFSVPVSASAYPPHRLRDGSATLIHAGRMDSNLNAQPLCKGIKAASILPDASQFNLEPVTCPSCLAKMRKLGIVIEVLS